MQTLSETGMILSGCFRPVKVMLQGMFVFRETDLGFPDEKEEFLMDKELVRQAIHDACIRAVTEISDDARGMISEALAKETNETAKSMLSSMLENLDIAKKLDKAVCQSPGYPTTWVSFGDVMPGTYIMNQTVDTVRTCGINIYDNGGPDGNYASNSNNTTKINSTNFWIIG